MTSEETSGHELANLQASTTQSSFDRQFRRRQTRMYDLQSTDTKLSADISSDDEKYPLLYCLRLVAHYGIHVFRVERGFKWNMRQDLGKGSTFAVEQADLPLKYANSDLSYNLSMGGDEEYFVDHTGTRWAARTVVAYKSLFDERSRDRLLPDLVRELQVLSHPSLQRHPNIVRLLGIAWLRKEDMAASLDSTEVGKSRECPILLCEKAPLGTFKDLMKPGQRSVSLQARLRLATDVLQGIVVRRSDLLCERYFTKRYPGFAFLRNHSWGY
ncbi:hypothetical protein K505DRAFT_230396 [Melanomma pulvis-pyrius CBS 109.77]|uniref:Protein kinase domain-containing protein n=1 Tax=Melanomma pulvis-pyrius CBS 109.77 TaxID=1314802 RepID=A0A6A6XT17_9PLEO|nr:hypothetical protein K505DRAFT_230396 [Melanomma pulvis-pyrius CBS 109.77]